MNITYGQTIPFPDKIPYERQGVAVPGTKRPGQTAHYRNGIWGFIDANTPGVFSTLDKVFELGLAKGKDRPLVGRRKIVSNSPLKFASSYTWETYGQIDERRRNVGSALTRLFRSGELGGGEFETIGIWSQNCPEWQLIGITAQSYDKVTVSLYDTLGADSVEYIINHAHVTVVFSSADHIPALLQLAHKTPALKMVVSFDELTSDAKKVLSAWGNTQGIKVKELRELEAEGKAHPLDVIPATPERVASICYTSGTTGNPKGAILKHKNLAIAAQAFLYGRSFEEDVILLSYLPLAHIYERVTELIAIMLGGRIGYFTGDPLRLLEDAQILKPSVFPSVPRVLNRVYQAAMAGGNVPGLKGNIFRKAVAVKLAQFHATGVVTHPFWDRLVFRKIQAVLGGNIEMVGSGSAPISAEVIEFLKIALGGNVTEGYGLTETCAACSLTWKGDSTCAGTVGAPYPVNEIKLIDVPAMEYTSEDKPNPRGEICIRGDNCFSAYYKDEKNTKEALDEEGWFHTGDVGEIDQFGRLKIIDRNILKLAQGEYVAVEKIENKHTSMPLVAQLLVHGDSLQSYLVGVLVPDPVQLASIASKIFGKPVAATDAPALAEACKDSRVNAHILDIFTQNAKRNKLNGFETIKRIHLSMVPFSVENNTLTPTMKIRRKDAYNLYKTELDALYALGEPKNNTAVL